MVALVLGVRVGLGVEVVLRLALALPLAVGLGRTALPWLRGRRRGRLRCCWGALTRWALW